jgi:hypothetical protein
MPATKQVLLSLILPCPRKLIVDNQLATINLLPLLHPRISNHKRLKHAPLHLLSHPHIRLVKQVNKLPQLLILSLTFVFVFEGLCQFSFKPLVLLANLPIFLS